MEVGDLASFIKNDKKSAFYIWKRVPETFSEFKNYRTIVHLRLYPSKPVPEIKTKDFFDTIKQEENFKMLILSKHEVCFTNSSIPAVRNASKKTFFTVLLFEPTSETHKNVKPYKCVVLENDVEFYSPISAGTKLINEIREKLLINKNPLPERARLVEKIKNQIKQKKNDV